MMKKAKKVPSRKPTMNILKDQVAELERTLKYEKEAITRLQKDNYDLHERMKLIAGENESLRKDKQWLQQMHSAVLQSMMSRGAR